MLKICLDTSVISALFDKRNPERMSSTSAFFREIENFELCISELVVMEIERTPDLELQNIAIAVANQMDYLLSWNFKHIVRVKIRDIVRMVNTIHGFRQVEIITPAELL